MRRIRWARSGRVEAVIAESEVRQVELGGPVADGPETSPRQVMAEALSDLEHDEGRMHYDPYRRAACR
ncbi:MAG: hypothetical protein ACM35G_05410 [Planctomycetaceae bacterium]